MSRADQQRWKVFKEGSVHSYSMIFFSINPWFGWLVLLLTMMDPITGLCGLLAVLLVNGLALLLGLNQDIIQRGEFGFNALLVGLGLGAFYELNLVLFLLLVFAVVITLFLTVIVMGILMKYELPFLSIPFVLALWIVLLASYNFEALGVSQRGLYLLNELYAVGDNYFVQTYQFLNELPIPVSIKTFFRSLGAILFQFNMISGFILALALFFYSRISFTLALLGFFSAFYFYQFIGADLTQLNYNIVGFNFILSAIAIGGFYLVPSFWSYLAVLIMMPILAILTSSLTNLLASFQLGTYSLPFNLIVISFLYVLKWRSYPTKPELVLFQTYSPEKNKYHYESNLERYKNFRAISVGLPFMGEWWIMQGHDGKHTHQREWKHAWDFVIVDKNGQQYQQEGQHLEDYYCYNKPIVAPADGKVVDLLDNVPDNAIGDVNLVQNWGNTIVIEHGYSLYSQISHIKTGSFELRKGDYVKKGQTIARCGNSGRSPYPHLHFQFQNTPYIGAATLEYPISLFLSREDRHPSAFHFFDYPAEHHFVQNVEVEPLLKRAFYFIPGQRIRFTSNGNETVEWECHTDAYNQTYLECKKTAARAYFQNNGTLHYFTNYYGRKNTLLYHFFLANYKVALSFQRGLAIKDAIPLDLLQEGKHRWIQDFLAPFYQYTTAGFELAYQHPKGSLSLTEIGLRSKVVLQRFRSPSIPFQYYTHIVNNTIISFTIEEAGRTTIAKRIADQEDSPDRKNEPS